MRFLDLSVAARSTADATIRALIKEEVVRGLQRIEDENRVRKESGRALLTDGQLATYMSWPEPLEPGQTRDRVEGELFTGPDERQYLFRYGSPTTYFSTKAQWGARARVVGYLQTFGMTEAEIEPELCRWFIPTYGVVTLLVVTNEGIDEALVGFRSTAVATNQGTLTLPGGFVCPRERLREAASRELRDEGGGSMPVEFLSGVSWGPHNIAPANLTFVIRARAASAEIRPCAEWKGNLMRRVSVAALASAVCDANYESLAGQLGVRDVQIAPDILAPLRPHLEAWRRGSF